MAQLNNTNDTEANNEFIKSMSNAGVQPLKK